MAGEKKLLAEEVSAEPEAEEINTESEVEEIKKEQKPNICDSLKGEGDGWIDDVHTYLSVEFCKPAVWFDSFFADKRIYEEGRAGTHLRWTNDYVLTEGGNWVYTSDVHASFELPKAKNKAHIIYDGEEDERLRDVAPVQQEPAKKDLGLLYAITQSERANFSIRLKLSPSILFRYRYTWPVTDTFTTRFTQELYRRDNLDGRSSRIDFEKRFSKALFLRQSNSVMHSEGFEGEQWDSSLVLYQYLSEKSALSYESSTTRLTYPESYIKASRLGVRYRRNFYRKWLFYEIAPAKNWSRPLPGDEREQSWEILFRLEVNFINE
ncbi:MAG: hypothetical protein PF589_04305 [Gammaproteobacteria bacterium]|nr:hypothetical protein [Gammaproteobacteria bacterium]